MNTSGTHPQPPMDSEVWRQLFIDQMRRSGASGRRIGDAIASVDEYCRESGTGPHAAFGDPADYARSLTGRSATWRWTVRYFLPALLVVLSASMVAWLPWRWGHSLVGVAWGPLLMPLWFCCYMAAFTLMWPQLKRHTGRGICLYMVTYLVWSLVNTTLRTDQHHAFTVPAWSLWTTAAVLALATAPLTRRAVADRVIDPRTGNSRDAAPEWAWRSLWLMAPLVPLAIVLLRWASR